MSNSHQPPRVLSESLRESLESSESPLQSLQRPSTVPSPPTTTHHQESLGREFLENPFIEPREECLESLLESLSRKAKRVPSASRMSMEVLQCIKNILKIYLVKSMENIEDVLGEPLRMFSWSGLGGVDWVGWVGWMDWVDWVELGGLGGVPKATHSTQSIGPPSIYTVHRRDLTESHHHPAPPTSKRALGVSSQSVS